MLDPLQMQKLFSYCRIIVPLWK